MNEIDIKNTFVKNIDSALEQAAQAISMEIKLKDYTFIQSVTELILSNRNLILFVYDDRDGNAIKLKELVEDVKNKSIVVSDQISILKGIQGSLWRDGENEK